MSANDMGQDIRRSAVAGQFYPHEPMALRAAINRAYTAPLGPGALPQVREERERRLLGVVVPHAGYPYSASCAAWAFAEVAAAGRPQAVVLLGVNHRGVGAPLALSPAQGWETPLGIMPVATAIRQRLQQLDSEVTLDARAHALEHSLEVQIPFLQALFRELYIIPLVLGQLSAHSVLRLGLALATLADEYDLLCVASSDLSHYLPQREAEVLDRVVLDQIAHVDPLGLIEAVQGRQITMCGVMPVATLLAVAREAGIVTAKILQYYTSGDVTGAGQEVVGYGAATVYR